ncbi:DUF5721 family protein [Parasporobacterium paucivorans]|nr:DUF5721 family protein [Parasporobacterium paucivorans]
MNDLLAGDTFDRFQITEASIQTGCTFTIDGHINSSFYSSEESEGLSARLISTWETVKPFCYMAMKGKKLPVRFKIILLAPDDLAQLLLSESGLAMELSEINGFFMNIKYEGGVLGIITGTSLNTFTLDKTLDKLWDGYVRSLLEPYDVV